MRVLSKPLVALVATAWIAVAAAVPAVKFDGHVHQIIEVCERFERRVAWAVGPDSWQYDTNLGASFELPCNFEEPHIAPLVAIWGHGTQSAQVGQVVITRLPDAHGVQLIILTDDGWVLDKAYAYVGHNPPPAYSYGKIRPGLFPEIANFECGSNVTYSEHIFAKVDTETALQVRSSILSNGQREWRQTRNALQREWRQAGRPLPWQQFLKSSLVKIAQDNPEPDCVIHVSVKVDVCRCRTWSTEPAILPLSGAVVAFRSLDKHNRVQWAYATTDANGYYSYDSRLWNQAGYFADTEIWVLSPTGVVVPDLSNVVLEAHRVYPGTEADLYNDFYPFIDGSDPAVVISPNEGGSPGETRAARSILNVDFYVVPN